MNNKKIKVAVIGATGLVGKELISILEQRNLPIRLYPLASKAGRCCTYKNIKLQIEPLNSFHDKLSSMNFVFNAGSNQTAHTVADILKRSNGKTVLVDNSSAFRKDNNIPLVIPEINKDTIKDNKIIASPNCSTSIVAMAINPLMKKYDIKRISAVTYQAASGGGKKLLDKLINQTKNYDFSRSPKISNDERQYAMNIYTHESPICLENGFSQEELKMHNEMQKLFNSNVQVSATCVRVPTIKSHAISLDIMFNSNDYPSPKVAYDLISKQEGVHIIDNMKENRFPEPVLADGLDEVLVGRIRKDIHRPNYLSMFVAGDQLRKGAALNAVQIMEAIHNTSF